MISYEPPGGINREDKLVEDISPAMMVLLDAENMLKIEGDLCNKDISKILTELAERKRSRIRFLERLI